MSRIALTPIIRTSVRRCAGRASSFSPSRTRPCLARTMACSGASTLKPALARMASWLSPASAIPKAARATERANVGRSCCRETYHFERREICFLATRNCRGFRIGQKHVGAGALTRPAERSSANWYLCKTRRAAAGRSVRAYVSIKTRAKREILLLSSGRIDCSPLTRSAMTNCRGFRGQKHVGAGALTRPAERSPQIGVYTRPAELRSPARTRRPGLPQHQKHERCEKSAFELAETKWRPPHA